MDRRPVGKKLAAIVVERLDEVYGRPPTTLDDREDPWRLLVAAILAAQCTDERVNQVTPALWKAFPELDDLAEALPSEIEPYIKSCGLYRNKAKNIHLAARYLREEHDSEVPGSLDALLKVPGVGRKIANLLLGDIFGIEAIVVDTHCARLANRIGLTKETTPAKIEQDLMRTVPESEWTNWGHLMVTHGREICMARNPQCPSCVLNDVCKEGRKIMRSYGA